MQIQRSGRIHGFFYPKHCGTIRWPVLTRSFGLAGKKGKPRTYLPRSLDPRLFWEHSSKGEQGLGTFRHDIRRGKWRKHAGASGSRAPRRISVPALLVFVVVAAAAAFATQPATRLDDLTSDAGPSRWLGSSPEPIIGVASVVDGDTIEIHGQRIRFNGIDAPESNQYCSDAKGFDYPCGRRSAEALEAFLAASRPVQCEFVTWDRYHRFVGNCRRADGISVAAWMVEHGQALDWPRYSHGAYSTQQAKAETAKLGIWVGTFQAPWEWRAQHAESSPSPKPLGLRDRRQVAQSGYSCEPRRYCSQISSCDEARWYLENCSWGGKLDRDKDGIPCEGLC
ncbi:thermonuclease family protein [Mesorhizobium sp. B3-1-3]|uniref:thermonuclease family protein n=1 Tax=unclassified Mesorhizobium TaxID=325217 RepID=UPI00112AB4D8|nr:MULTISPECIES: thermonuclease family protein [unclassified Mesorhizobium]TPI62620.1 thermonuclease family protein [Mesorhizobium sp. B3-1-8]TPI74195.1 thermonuclease family protein [Mesorhizobium sp. B3-1-3]